MTPRTLKVFLFFEIKKMFDHFLEKYLKTTLAFGIPIITHLMAKEIKKLFS